MRLSGWVSRFAAVGLLIVAIGLVWSMLIQPVIDAVSAHRDSIAQSEAMLARYKALNAARGAMDRRLQELHAEEGSEDRLLTGASAQLAGAKLQNHLKEVIEANKGTVGSMQILPVRDEDGFRRVSLGVMLTATIDSLQPILYTLEQKRPYLFVEDLQLRTSDSAGRDPLAAQKLQVHFNVYGYMAGDAP